MNRYVGPRCGAGCFAHSVAILLVALIAPLMALPPLNVAAAEDRPFGIYDYFKLKNVTELSLSSDGAMIAFVVQSKSLEENRVVRTVYVSPTEPGVEPFLIDKILEATSFAWIPGTQELAYLSSDGNVTQVHSINIKTNAVRQHTYGDNPVLQFLFSPDGGALSWLIQTAPANKNPLLYDRMFNGEEGVVIDSENTAIYHFVDPEARGFKAKPSNQLWLKRAGTEAFPVDVPGQVKTFYWSSNASKLSITYAKNDLPDKALMQFYTSVGVFDMEAMTFRAFAHARPPLGSRGGQFYNGGEWIPNTHRLYLRRNTEHFPMWNAAVAWTTVDVADTEGLDLDDQTLDWHEIDIYRIDSAPAFIPVNSNIIYSNMMVRARRSLFQITPSGPERADILKEVEGSVSLVRFSANFETATFISESLTRLPEIYIWRKGSGLKKLTQLNREIADKRLPNAREVTWKSKDGVVVQGWLFEPAGEKPDNKPWPLITFVHGGPRLAIINEFAFYKKLYGGLWPYPFEVYALNGMAVFIPNYRGTATFGDEFMNPDNIYGEPVDDIISGIDYLTSEGIADPKRLAISGHSHGAWLGQLVMTRRKGFLVGSFAEGINNMITAYDLAPGFLNRTQDIILGSGDSLYDNPQRYIEISPSLHFQGLDTAVLFEAGVKSLAIDMLGAPKAAQRAGMPTEFVIYPQTGHNISLPRLQKESAERNLDWFRFWLLGEEDPGSAKSEQYARWRKLRSKDIKSILDKHASFD